jgi:hypothetical protein
MLLDRRRTRLGGDGGDLQNIRAQKAYFIAHLAGEAEIRTKKVYSIREVLPGYFHPPYRIKALHLVLCSLAYRRREGRIVQLAAEGERLYAVSAASGELVIARQEFRWKRK